MVWMRRSANEIRGGSVKCELARTERDGEQDSVPGYGTGSKLPVLGHVLLCVQERGHGDELYAIGLSQNLPPGPILNR